MNRLLCLLAAIVLSTSAALAADDDEADERAGHTPSAEAADSPGADEHEHAVMSATHLQQNMKMMQELMVKIRETTDPEEKKRLLKAHMLAMQEQIKVMRAMSAMRGGHHHGQHGKGGEMMRGDMMGGGMQMKQHRMMERRMDAMEQLMEQLIEHEGVESQLEGR